jgi:hypothetical protein
MGDRSRVVSEGFWRRFRFGRAHAEPALGSYPNLARSAPRVSGAKLPAHVDRFIYRIDRTDQCKVLLTHFEAHFGAGLPTRPVCAIAAGTEEDYPTLLGNTLVDFITREVLSRQSLPDFLSPKTPLCVPWQRLWANSDRAWNEIGHRFLDLPATTEAKEVRSKLMQRTGSIAFGVEIDVDAWSAHSRNLLDWIKSLQECESASRGLVLALVVVSGAPAKVKQVGSAHRALKDQFQTNPNVLVLPLLDKIGYSEFKEWHRNLLDLAEKDGAGDLQHVLNDLFAGETDRPMCELWSPLRDYVAHAWQQT